mgnify:CR=1 FL=1
MGKDGENDRKYDGKWTEIEEIDGKLNELAV